MNPRLRAWLRAWFRDIRDGLDSAAQLVWDLMCGPELWCWLGLVALVLFADWGCP